MFQQSAWIQCPIFSSKSNQTLLPESDLKYNYINMLPDLISEAYKVDQIFFHKLTIIWLANRIWVILARGGSEICAQSNKSHTKGLYDKIVEWIRYDDDNVAGIVADWEMNRQGILLILTQKYSIFHHVLWGLLLSPGEQDWSLSHVLFIAHPHSCMENKCCPLYKEGEAFWLNKFTCLW